MRGRRARTCADLSWTYGGGCERCSTTTRSEVCAVPGLRAACGAPTAARRDAGSVERK